MLTKKGIPAYYQQPWMASPQQYTADMDYDDERDVMEFDLPNGSRVGLSYREIRAMVAGIESRKVAGE